MSVPFVHLRLHSEFSVVDGLVQLDEAARAAAADGQGALALTDSANMFGAVRFYKAARAQGVKPIVGVDAWLSNDAERDSPHRLLLLAMDHGGYLRLCDLVSRAWIENQHRARAEMRPECSPAPAALASSRCRAPRRARSARSWRSATRPRRARREINSV